MKNHIIVIDEGTSSTRVMAYNESMAVVAKAQYEVALTYPQPGWVEQDAANMWALTLKALKEVILGIGGADKAAGIGITNQRETTVAWDKVTLEPLSPAIVWQDRRTTLHCEAMKANGHEDAVQYTTGLLLDPYFSATKMSWFLKNSRAVQDAHHQDRLAMGTVDAWLIANLTEGAKHITDTSNASRTLLMDLHRDSWSHDMMHLFGVPESVLPDIVPSGAHFGDCTLFSTPIPILASIGDQQSALFGQGCVKDGEAKITYGTGGFLLAHTGLKPLQSGHKLLSTRLATQQGRPAEYGLEGAIFNAGNIIKWLRDSVGLVQTAQESEAAAASLKGNDGVYLVPAFSGLGAPHWRADVLANISGLSGGTGAAHIVRAGLEAVAYQTRDLLDAFSSDGSAITGPLRVDGGMVANDWLMQFIADICELDLVRPTDLETTARGAALMVALELGWIHHVEDGLGQGATTEFSAMMAASERDSNIEGWKSALGKLMS